MKYLLLLFFFPAFCVAQNTPLQLAEDVFAMCVKNDEAAFVAAIPDVAAFTYLVTEYGGRADITDEMIKIEQEKNVTRALKGFRMLQQTVKELEIDISKAVITRREVLDKESRWKRDGKDVNIPMKEITFFFTCNGKNLAFRIADAMDLNGRWYVGHEYISIHWLD